VKFSDLQFHSSLQSTLDSIGFQECTPVQEHTIPAILDGKDVAGLAQTGTGKTAAFLLPLMERILRARDAKHVSSSAPSEGAPADGVSPEGAVAEAVASEVTSKKPEERGFDGWAPMNFILDLVPTRELAEQVYENAVKFSAGTGLRAVSIYGGVSYDKQKEALRGGVEFVIATPGRLIDLYKENLVDMKQVRAIVFDEADRMFDMGFKDDMKYILTRVPKERQFLVFSATLNLDVLNTAYQFGANPVEFNVSRDQAKAENVEDKILHVGQDEKGVNLLGLLKLHAPRQAIIFSNFKMNVPRITQFLNDNGFPAVAISSLLTQSQRNRVMEQFKGDSDKNILVATDVAARGLDIKGVDLVVNFELPDDPENYVHRIGRTGRAGAKGLAFSLVSDRDVDALSRVEGYLKHKVATDFLEEDHLPKDYKAMQADRSQKDFSREFEGRGPRSDSDRGPRRDGRGPRRDGEGRGPRRDGDRGRDRNRSGHGGRDGGRDEQRASGQGPRPGGGRITPRDPNAPPIQASSRHPDRAQGQGHKNGKFNGKPSRGDRGQNRFAKGDGRGENRGRDQKHGGKHGQKHGKGGSRPIPVSQQKSIGQKVTGFFKRIFGG
jgi:ATP-dependent RNA helicase RhlB